MLLLGSAKEAELRETIATEVNTQTPGKCQNLAGKTALGLALSIIYATKLIAINDSGLMHVAAALGVRQPPLDCAPCFERSCPLGHTRCLNDLSPAAVLASLSP